MRGKSFHTLREGLICLENEKHSFWIVPLPGRASIIAGTDGGLYTDAWAKVGSFVAGAA